MINQGYMFVKGIAISLILMIYGLAGAQIAVEIDGSIKINGIKQDSNSDSLLVWKSDGTAGYREVASILHSEKEWFIGKDTLGGIVFYIYDDSDGSKHGLIVSKNEKDTVLQDPSYKVNANRSWDGKYNTDLLADSPAKDYVSGLGAEWYIPSIDELNLLWQNRFKVNHALFESNHTLLSSSTYWSSTESISSEAFYFTFSWGRIFSAVKTGAMNIRAIKAF